MNLAFLNIGTQEMVLIVIVILFLFGGKKLPELARGLGRGIREFKDASDGIKREISDQINNFEKDLDVEEDIKSAQSVQTQKSADIKGEIAQNSQQSSAEKTAESTLPKFGPPAGTYQHNPDGSVDEEGVYDEEEAYYDDFDQQNETTYTDAPEEDDVTPFVQPDSEQDDTKNT